MWFRRSNVASEPAVSNPMRCFACVAHPRLLSGLLMATMLLGTAEGQIVEFGSLVANSAWHDQEFAEVAAGYFHTVVRRSNGSVLAWGRNEEGQCNVPALPAGLTYVEIAAGRFHTVGAAERRLGRRLGRQPLRPVQRAGASGRAHLRRGRGGR